MPPEAAQYWFEVTGVWVMQIKDLTPRQLLDSALTDIDIDENFPPEIKATAHLVRQAECAQKWNREFAPLRWDGDYPVVVLSLKAIAVPS
jgi:hypothetical protein